MPGAVYDPARGRRVLRDGLAPGELMLPSLRTRAGFALQAADAGQLEQRLAAISVHARGRLMQLHEKLHTVFCNSGGPVSWPAVLERVFQEVRTQFQVAGVQEFDLHFAGNRLSLNRRPIRFDGSDHVRALTVGQWLSGIGVVQLRVKATLESAHVVSLVQFVEQLRRGERTCVGHMKVGASPLC